MAHELSRCPICGCPPVVYGDVYAGWTVRCCGYGVSSFSSVNDVTKKWNQHVEIRNKLRNAATAHRESMELFRRKSNPQIKKVHFNKPATVILWTDGTKTIVKAQDGETYDPEKGMALAIAKKFLGNKGNYYNIFDKYLSELEKVDCKECPGTNHGRKTECTRNQDIPCPTKKDVEKPKYEQLMIKDCSIGDEVYIKDGLINGCRGAIGLCGFVAVDKSGRGLLDIDPGVNILLRNGAVWRVNPDCIVERIKKAPSRKKNKN